MFSGGIRKYLLKYSIAGVSSCVYIVIYIWMNDNCFNAQQTIRINV